MSGGADAPVICPQARDALGETRAQLQGEIGECQPEYVAVSTCVKEAIDSYEIEAEAAGMPHRHSRSSERRGHPAGLRCRIRVGPDASRNKADKQPMRIAPDRGRPKGGDQ